MNSRERCLAAIRGEHVDRVPVFPLLMSFAASRLGITCRQYASSGHALAEAQLKTRELFGLDAITVCSDAFRLSADLGGEIIFPEETPPFIARPLVRSEADFNRLARPDATRPDRRRANRVLATRDLARAV